MADLTCTHDACNCKIEDGELYCSDACKEAVKIADKSGNCPCDHDHCGA